MFTVYHSNQIDLLKSLLVELIRSSPLDNPFEKEQILVQSPGMSQWLKMEMAAELGVAANIEFPLPATFIWNMFVQVLDDVPERSAFNKESMTWKLLLLLPSCLHREEFAPLASYLANDDDKSKLYQLAEKIADIFDGYLVYRPEWIAAWEAGLPVDELQGEQEWQPILWKTLYDHTLAQQESHYHRANLYHDFIHCLQHSDLSELTFPKRLFVFGISSLPPRYMDALKALGEHMDVHLMFTNPCRYYWGDVRDRKYLAKLQMNSRQHLQWRAGQSELIGETAQLKGTLEHNLLENFHSDVIGNSLLASMGKLGRDNMYLLSQLSSNEVEAFVDIPRDSLLHQIQADILNLEERQDDKNIADSQHKLTVSAADDSLMLHACHSPMREVEVLHDNLLAMFDGNPQLKPRNIIVMVADINAYSPAIQAVFGNAPSDRYIPFSISDRTVADESPVLTAFLDLVNLPSSRCLSSELIELLNIPEVLAKYQITEQEFERLRMWIEEAGIRWGMNSHTAEEFDLPEMPQNSWLFGVQRMLLGYAMHNSVGFYQDAQQLIAPYNEVQGLDAELAGKLAHFIDKITYYRQELALSLTVEQWQQKLIALIDDFFEVELDGEIALKTIRDTLQQLREQLDSISYTDTIAPRVIIEYLTSKLSSSRVSQRFLAGQVNFCTLMPMRSIPFDVVCLLGMNDGVYPRSMPAEGFDLINGRARAGDRSRRDDDRYLFLEALLSAQQKLYISYIAQSIQDNSERVPSTLVSELLEYCAANFCLKGEEVLASDDSAENMIRALITHHAMVPYSQSAFDGSTPSYAAEWLGVVNNRRAEQKPFIQPLPELLQRDEVSSDDSKLELDLNELQRFWRLPVKYFFNRRLKIYFEPIESLTDSNEPFVLDGLQSYLLRDELLAETLAARVNGTDEQQVANDYLTLQRAKGVLPVGAFGDLEFELNSNKTEQLVNRLAELCQQKRADIEVDTELFLPDLPLPCSLSGWVKNHYSSGIVHYRSGKIRSQDWLAAWIDHLCCATMSMPLKTHLIGYDNKAGLEHHIIAEVDKEQAEQWLMELLTLYYQGLNAPLAYFPKTALSGVKQLLKGKEDMEDKMSATFHDSFFFAGEGSDDYISRVWPEWDQALYEVLWHNAQLVLLNVFANSEDNC
ncbi:exodeoxyribonuclease V subunit gamma [Vibrio sp. MACH09]|uniref:exodeoxyribonuclease V subunit gamma n=1 Tax=Vibrio sp. MACH09 TaxID=3025122 RepID=UPI00295E69DF|nr:exodeoxyribonuclease V subunit gamma [Vibrio sp. MACH09]